MFIFFNYINSTLFQLVRHFYLIYICLQMPCHTSGKYLLFNGNNCIASIVSCIHFQPYAEVNHSWSWWEILLPFIFFLNNITGCILIFEYLYFLLQSNKNQRHTLELAINTYQNSEIQATVINSLQNAIHQFEDDHDILSMVIIDIILNNQMCKSSLL